MGEGIDERHGIVHDGIELTPQITSTVEQVVRLAHQVLNTKPQTLEVLLQQGIKISSGSFASIDGKAGKVLTVNSGDFVVYEAVDAKSGTRDLSISDRWQPGQQTLELNRTFNLRASKDLGEVADKLLDATR